jgi:hypothetical protein
MEAPRFQRGIAGVAFLLLWDAVVLENTIARLGKWSSLPSVNPVAVLTLTIYQAQMS